MSESSYRVVFDGDIVDGFSIGQVKKNLAKLFKADEDRIATIFSGQTVVLKRNVDEQTARKYQAALQKAGAQTSIRGGDEQAAPATQTGAAQTQAAAPVAQTEETAASSAEADTEQDWSLAATGSDLLKAHEKRPFEEREIDLSHISLASSFMSFDADEATGQSPAPDTSHMSIAEVGATLDDGSSRPVPVAVADLDATLAPPGADIGDAKEPAPAPDLDLSHLSVE